LKEGVRVPPIKILEQWHVRSDMLGMMLANMRIPADREGDFRAQLAGARRAEARVRDLARRYGIDTLTEVMQATQTYSKRLVSLRLRSLPDAEVAYEERLDGDGIDPNKRPLIKVRISKKSAAFRVDFTGSDPCVPGRSMPRSR